MRAVSVVLLALAVVAGVISCSSAAPRSGSGPEACVGGRGSHRVEVGLPNRNMASVRAHALAASDPDHPTLYGKFLTFDEMRALVHDPAALDAVLRFLAPYAAQDPSRLSVTPDGQWVTLHAVCAGEAAKLAELLPSELGSAVDRVHVYGGDGGADNVDVRHHRVVKAQRAAGTPAPSPQPDSVPTSWPPGPPVTPYLTMKDVRSFYNVTPPANTPPASPVTAAVFEVNALEYNGEIVERWNPQDLSSFQKLCGLPASPVTHFRGDNVTLGCEEYTCAEPVLDVELLRALAPWANFTYWSTNLPNAPNTCAMMVWLTRLASVRSPSAVQSMSWGPGEAGHSPDLLNRMDEEFAKLSARGVSFITSSGDDGVNDRTARGAPSNCGLAPQYPATSPWVTAVGGTFGPEYGEPERTAATDAPHKCDITSGGGFSTVYPQPQYQADAVKGYLARMANTKTLPPASTYNASNRGYPDVALQAHNLDNIVNQAFFPGSGTSASAPLFAGMVTLVAQARQDMGLPPLGLLNVRMYKLAGTPASPFNDITVGDNHCTGVYGAQQLHTCCPYGFTATDGWDPLTGLGTVDFKRFHAALTSQ